MAPTGRSRRTARDILPVEARLLLTTVCPDPAGDRVERLWEEGRPDGSLLLALAHRERAFPVAWRGLEGALGALLPPGMVDRFRAAAMVWEFRLDRMERRLAESVAALTEAGIEVMLLKGAGLACTRYPSFRERPMLDLDLLVLPSEADQAEEVLFGAGWIRHPGVPGEATYRRHHHRPPLVDAGRTGAVLELHTGLLRSGHPFALDGRQLRREAATARVGGVEVRVPSPSGHLLHLCLHFAWSHALCTGGWRTFRDVRVLLEPANGEAPPVSSFPFERLESGEGRAAVYWTLRLASELGGVRVPEAWLLELEPALGRRRGDLLARHFALQLFPAGHGCPSVALGRRFWRRAMMAGTSSSATLLPWEASTDFRVEARREPAPAGRGGIPSGLVRSLGNAGRWSRYLGALLRPV